MKKCIEENVVVEYDYVAHSSEGEVIEKSSPETPVIYLHGTNEILPGLEREFSGREIGQYHFVVPAAEAYGPLKKELIFDVDKAKFPRGDEVPVGTYLDFTGTNASGLEINSEGRVVAVNRDTITLDFNEELAGQDLHFDINIRLIREATPVELATQQGLRFPNDVIRELSIFEGPDGDRLRGVKDISLSPPFPWGTWLYGKLLRERCGELDGDVIELGVGAGGVSVYLAHIAKDMGKRVYSLDSYQGLPAPDPEKDNPYFLETDYRGEKLLERYKKRIQKEGLNDIITPIAGFFADTVPLLPSDLRICFAHLDSDLYESIMTSLEGIYDRMPDGGVMIIDDFFHKAQGPLRACSHFFNRKSIQPVYHVTFPYSVGIIKGESPDPEMIESIDGNIYSFDWLRSDKYLIAKVRESIGRQCDETRAKENSRLLLDIITRSEHRSSDIYLYWKAMEDFFESDPPD